MTAFLAVWDSATTKFVFSRAGHNSPLWLRAATGEVTELSHAGGLPLVIFSALAYDQQKICLSPGDIVILFSDGIVAHENPAGKSFDHEILKTTLKNASAGSADEILRAIKMAVDAHQQGSRAQDDQTLFVLRPCRFWHLPLGYRFHNSQRQFVRLNSRKFICP